LLRTLLRSAQAMVSETLPPVSLSSRSKGRHSFRAGPKDVAARWAEGVDVASRSTSTPVLRRRSFMDGQRKLDERFVASSLGTMPDAVLVEVIAAIQEEVERRAHAYPVLGADPMKMTVSDEVLLQVTAYVQHEASERNSRRESFRDSPPPPRPSPAASPQQPPPLSGPSPPPAPPWALWGAVMRLLPSRLVEWLDPAWSPLNSRHPSHCPPPACSVGSASAGPKNKKACDQERARAKSSSEPTTTTTTTAQPEDGMAGGSPAKPGASTTTTTGTPRPLESGNGGLEKKQKKQPRKGCKGGKGGKGGKKQSGAKPRR